jgi:glycosyltransferase involved in cell wall biosynthesis
MEQIKLLLLVTQLERAGAQKVALLQARYFFRRGYSVTLCFLYDKYDLLQEFEKTEPYRVLNLGAKIRGGSSLVNILATVRAIWCLYWLLRKERFHVIETLSHYSNIIGIIVAWLAGVPVRISSRHIRLVDLPKWLWRIESWLVNSSLVDKMIAVSEQTRYFCLEAEGMSPNKVLTIPNGVDLSAFDKQQWTLQELERLRNSLGISPGITILTTVGRLHPQKGHTYLIQAIAEIKKVRDDFVCLFAGNGELRAQISQQIYQQGVEKHVRLLGVREDVPQLLAISDMFVLPSLHEGMPMALLEAMAAQLPVIATAVDGTNELVVDGETGLLVPPADPTALSQAILTLLNDPDRRHKMGQKGYERVREHFSEQVMCQRYEEVIQAILTEKLGVDDPKEHDWKAHLRELIARVEHILERNKQARNGREAQR